MPDARPYPWPYDGEVAVARSALVVVAAQVELATRCPQSAAAALAAMAALVGAVGRWGAPVVAVRHAASPAQRRPGLLPAAGSASWELVDGLDADVVIDAYGMDGFSGSPLANLLSGIGRDHLLLCGLGLEGPVHSTLRSANDRGLECLLVTDACAAFEPALAGAAGRIVEMSGGIFGAVACCATVMAALGAPGATEPAGAEHG